MFIWLRSDSVRAQTQVVSTACCLLSSRRDPWQKFPGSGTVHYLPTPEGPSDKLKLNSKEVLPGN